MNPVKFWHILDFKQSKNMQRIEQDENLNFETIFNYQTEAKFHNPSQFLRYYADLSDMLPSAE
jgi:hypothetical protein